MLQYLPILGHFVLWARILTILKGQVPVAWHPASWISRVLGRGVNVMGALCWAHLQGSWSDHCRDLDQCYKTWLLDLAAKTKELGVHSLRCALLSVWE